MILDKETFDLLQDLRTHLIGIIEKVVRDSGGSVTLDNVKHPVVSLDDFVVVNYFRKIFLDKDMLIVQYDDDYYGEMQDNIEMFTIDEILQMIDGL